jgi:MFS family permease
VGTSCSCGALVSAAAPDGGDEEGVSAATDDRVWAPHRRVLATGLVLTITMVAFENLGVATAMPVVARDLDGVGLYGWTVTATFLGSIVGISLAGERVDHTGPAGPFVGGLALFAVGLVGCGVAPTMPFLVASRFVQGLGVGAVPAVVYAAIGRAFSERSRARLFAVLSTAWVVPGLVGPGLSGFVAEGIGWRWVFLGVLPLVAINGALTLPALARLGPPPVVEVGELREDRRRLRFAVALAASTALLVGGLERASADLLALLLVAVGAAAAVVPLRRLLPAGTFVARPGVPAAVATRGMQAFCFFGGEAFLPLSLTSVRGQRAGVAGLALTASTLSWAAGAWLQDRRGQVWGRRTMVRRGLTCLVVGVAGAGAVAVTDALPVALTAAAWTLAGLGMGMSYSGLSLVVLDESGTGQEGRAVSALQLAEMLSIAVGAGAAGAVVAAATRAGNLRAGLALAFVLPVAAGVVAVATSWRRP